MRRRTTAKHLFLFLLIFFPFFFVFWASTPPTQNTLSTTAGTYFFLVVSLSTFLRCCISFTRVYRIYERRNKKRRTVKWRKKKTRRALLPEPFSLTVSALYVACTRQIPLFPILYTLSCGLLYFVFIEHADEDDRHGAKSNMRIR